MLKKISPILLVILLAIVVRVFGITDNPPSLNWDEISHGYNAFSILKSGRDEWGEFLPTIFRAYGDYKLPLYIYLTAISEFFFGLNAFSVRLVSLLAGVGTVAFTYLLTKKLFREDKVAVLSSLLVALEPWSLFLSRGAFEANLALFLITAGAYFFISGIDKIKYLTFSALFLGLSLWTYNSARVFVPLLLSVLVISYWKELKKTYKKSLKALMVPVVTMAIFLVPMLFQLFSTSGLARYSKVSIIDEGAIAEINEARRVSEASPIVSRLVSNKVTYFSKVFAGNWLSHFSPEFLFFEGGSHFQFSVPGHGLLYLVNLPFFLIGLISLIKRRDKVSTILISWLLLGAVAASLTRESPHVLRSIVILPVPMILVALGLSNSLDFLKKKGKLLVVPFAITYLVLLGVSLGKYLKSYFGEYREAYSWSWQYGNKEAVNYAKENYSEYDKILITKKYGEPHEFVLFYWPWEPTDYRQDPNLNRFYQSGWYWVDSFDKFFFLNDWQVKELKLESGGEVGCEETKCLLITSPGNAPEGWQLIKVINFLDGAVAFEIYENI